MRCAQRATGRQIVAGLLLTGLLLAPGQRWAVDASVAAAQAPTAPPIAQLVLATRRLEEAPRDRRWVLSSTLSI